MSSQRTTSGDNTLKDSFVFHSHKGGVGKSTLLFNVVDGYARRNPTINVLVVDCSYYHDISRRLLGDSGISTDNLNAVPSDKYITHLISILAATGASKDVNFSTPDAHVLRILDVDDRNLKMKDRLSPNVFLAPMNPNALKQNKNNNAKAAGLNQEDIPEVAKRFVSALESSGKAWAIFFDTDAEYHNYTRFALAVAEKAVVPFRVDPDDWFRMDVMIQKLGALKERNARISLFVANDVKSASNKEVEMENGVQVGSFELLDVDRKVYTEIAARLFDRYKDLQEQDIFYDDDNVKNHLPNSDAVSHFKNRYITFYRHLQTVMQESKKTGVPVTSPEAKRHIKGDQLPSAIKETLGIVDGITRSAVNKDLADIFEQQVKCG